jgi:hypothetical protein
MKKSTPKAPPRFYVEYYRRDRAGKLQCTSGKHSNERPQWAGVSRVVHEMRVYELSYAKYRDEV